jgi:iron complex transport system substrate-binding protein
MSKSEHTNHGEKSCAAEYAKAILAGKQGSGKNYAAKTVTARIESRELSTTIAARKSWRKFLACTLLLMTTLDYTFCTFMTQTSTPASHLALRPSLPRRIVCLTEETTETLYALGADELIVGVSGFTVRPKEARKTKPTVSTYLDANTAAILALRPDVVLAWSDLQASICADLIREGIEVVCFNHRSVEGILSMILRLGTLVGKGSEAERYVEGLMRSLTDYAERGRKRSRRPRVYFEEWYDPLISGICWVSELIELCGGDDIFAENRHFPDAKRRIIADPQEVVRRAPEVMLASWCGKMFKPERVLARSQTIEGWSGIPAIATRQMHEIVSPVILQPGPAALTDGVQRIMAVLDAWERAQMQMRMQA